MIDNKKLKVINLLGGPGTGKSTSAASLFALMKREYYNVELVTEYAKDLVWAERNNMFTEQDYMFAKQNQRLRRLVGKVNFAITDSPLFLSTIYGANFYPETFAPFVMDVFNSYTNINIFMVRKKKYVALGRNQTEDEARQIDVEVRHALERMGQTCYVVDADEHAARNILDTIESICGKNDAPTAS